MSQAVDDLDMNSPRTLEACLHKGLLVEELLPRKPKKFSAPGMSKEVAERRYEFFEKRRQDKLSMVRSQREEIVRSQMDASLARPDPRSTVGVPPGTIDLTPQNDNSASVSLLEVKRIEAIKKRQAKELSRMI